MNASAAVAPKPRVQFPKKTKCLFEPAPYKIFHGGRGSAKSWSFCRALLTIGTTRSLNILCTREVQKSIDESVYKLLCNQITAMGLDHFYKAMDTEIRGINGTRFVFAGLKNQFHKIKSYEAIDICAVFEATFISEPAWVVLEPTIRRDPPYGPFGLGSEIWVELNPELATDATYNRFVVERIPGSVVVEMNYWDNPWFPEILRRQMERMKAKDRDEYNTVWAGKPRRVLKGAIYAKELQAALDDDPCRITPNVHYDPKRPVDVAFDLGRADACALWFFQQFGMDYAVVQYYENTGYDFSHYIDYIRELKHQGKAWRIRKVILPHDAKAKVISARFSVLQQARDEWGNERVPKPIPAVSDVIQINAVRTLFPRLFFGEGPTSEGVQHLQHFRYGVDEKGQRTALPLHDAHSHAAKSLAYYALSHQADIYDRDDEPEDALTGKLASTETYRDQPTGWMR